MAEQDQDPADFLGSKICGDRYEILSRLGTGSMGHVYRAYDSRLESNVVIKIPTVSRLQDSEFRARFDREAVLLVRLSHPHVVKIIDIGQHEDIPLVVMQYLSGGTLQDRMRDDDKKQKACDSSTLGEWLREIAKALDFVHAQGTVHRDVKPGNIIFDEHGNAYLADFGLTKILYGEPAGDANDETGAGFVVGTPNYIAPEIVLGEEYGGRADQYSLALTVYEYLAGHPPMQGKTTSATMVNQTRVTPKSLIDINETVPSHVSAAVAKAISKKPENRYDSCLEFAEAVLLSQSTAAEMSQISSSRNRRSSSKNRVRPKQLKKKKTDHGEISQQSASSDELYEYGSSDEYASDPYADSMDASYAGLPSSSVGKVSRGKPGLVDCPKCKQALPIRPEHAGRTGNCVHCNVRLKIGPKAASLKVIPKRSGSRSGKRSGQSGSLKIGEENLFGVRLSQNTATIIAIVLIVLVVGLAIGLTVYFTKDDDDGPRFRDTEGRSITALTVTDFRDCSTAG